MSEDPTMLKPSSSGFSQCLDGSPPRNPLRAALSCLMVETGNINKVFSPVSFQAEVEDLLLTCKVLNALAPQCYLKDHPLPCELAQLAGSIPMSRVGAWVNPTQPSL